jgi:hypothetical protein
VCLRLRPSLRLHEARWDPLVCDHLSRSPTGRKSILTPTPTTWRSAQARFCRLRVLINISASNNPRPGHPTFEKAHIVLLRTRALGQGRQSLSKSILLSSIPHLVTTGVALLSSPSPIMSPLSKYLTALSGRMGSRWALLVKV